VVPDGFGLLLIAVLAGVAALIALFSVDWN
jgi:hypothetical protein